MRLVEEMAFAYCGGLEEVDLPTNIDSIEEGLFADCGSLTPITIPKKVDRMGTGTFHNCIYNHRTTKTNQKYPSVNL